jgi:ParB-like chromosome segregation protein Spo0J
MTAAEPMVEIERLGEALVGLRLCSDEGMRQMLASLERHGQLTSVAVYAAGDVQLEVIDGFKRLRAARQLGWTELRTRLLCVDGPQAKAAALVLNGGRGLSELEEGWLVRSLHRDDRLTQPEIGQLLGRHKSWVCRRLALVEGLDDVVQADVRLGLLAPSAAMALCRLPRRNQHAAAEVVVRRGLTSRQTDQLVVQALAHTDLAAQATFLARELTRSTPPPPRPHSSAERGPVEALIADVAALTRISARLQARLLGQPLSAHGPGAAALIAEALQGLEPVVGALRHTIQLALGGRHGIVDQP